MISEAILQSNAPESKKLIIRVLDKIQGIDEALHEGIGEKFCIPENNANAETLKTVLEYLQFVELGIKQFTESTPLVKDTED